MKQSFECANLEFDYNFSSAIAFTQSLDYTRTLNLRLLLGDMYHKYDTFIIYFNSIGAWTTFTSYSAGTVGSLNSTAVWTLGFSGLIWVNNSFNGSLNNSLAYFPDRFTLPINGFLGYNSSIQSGLVFRKSSSEVVNITVSPYLIRSGFSGSAVGTGAGQFDINMSFTIYGLYED